MSRSSVCRNQCWANCHTYLSELLWRPTLPWFCPREWPCKALMRWLWWTIEQAFCFQAQVWNCPYRERVFPWTIHGWLHAMTRTIFVLCLCESCYAWMLRVCSFSSALWYSEAMPYSRCDISKGSASLWRSGSRRSLAFRLICRVPWCWTLECRSSCSFQRFCRLFCSSSTRSYASIHRCMRL